MGDILRTKETITCISHLLRRMIPDPILGCSNSELFSWIHRPSSGIWIRESFLGDSNLYETLVAKEILDEAREKGLIEWLPMKDGRESRRKFAVTKKGRRAFHLFWLERPEYIPTTAFNCFWFWRPEHKQVVEGRPILTTTR